MKVDMVTCMPAMLALGGRRPSTQKLKLILGYLEGLKLG